MLLVLLAIVTWDLARRTGTRSNGFELRRATQEGELKRMEEILRQHPQVANSQGSKSLFRRLSDASPEWLQNRLPKGTELEEAEAAGATALHWATARKDVAAMNLLLAAGALPDAKLVNGATPMILAIADQRADLVVLLVESGADLNITNPADDNPLVVSANFGNRSTNITRLLLQLGANPNLTLANGQTPIHEVIDRRVVGTLGVLIEGGARLNATNSRGLTPLDYAVKRNATNEIILLQLLEATP